MSFAASLALTAALVTVSSTALAAKKKGAKPKTTESTDTAAPAASGSGTSAPSAPATDPAPAAPAASAETATPKPDAAAAPPAEAAPQSTVDITDTKEDLDKRYYFLGLRYRGTIIPQFFESLFVDEGGTVYSNTFGLELDMRKGGQSTIPWIVYTDYNMGDTLFHQKGTDQTLAGNYTIVSSGLKAIYLGLDELWSAPLDTNHHLDFEFGFGVGIGFVFGDLINDWAMEDPAMSSPFVAANGKHYVICPSEGAGSGCNKADHQNAAIAKVNNYKEPNWFNGGSVPTIFPNITFPALGLRYKPIKQLETRLQVGFSLTGFWFQLSADYGFEKAEDKNVKASTSLHRSRDML
jgi:hypothetical protein